MTKQLETEFQTVNRPLKNPLRFIVNGTLTLAILTFVAYLVFLGLSMQSSANSQLPIQPEIAKNIAFEIREFGVFAFEFIKPFLQLTIMLIIVDWLLRRIGIKYKLDFKLTDINTQTVIGLILICAFTLSALSGVGVGHLKDIALVVVGFYFGTQKRTIKYQTEDQNIVVEEEHKNPRES